jgi:hypothetical protein
MTKPNIAQRINQELTSIDFARFFENVTIGDSSSSCWQWHSGRDPDGYGIFSSQGKSYRAHRWLYRVIHGEICSSLVVRHKCDNPSCVNLRHLELGTVADNKRDQMERGRMPDRKGEKHPSSLLTDDQVRDIRRRVSCGEKHAHLAAEYGVSRQHIGKIVSLETWIHVS